MNYDNLSESYKIVIANSFHNWFVNDNESGNEVFIGLLFSYFKF